MPLANLNKPATAVAPATSYKGALIVLTTLFFMWGSLTSLNDVLIPYVENVFNIRLAAEHVDPNCVLLGLLHLLAPGSQDHRLDRIQAGHSGRTADHGCSLPRFLSGGEASLVPLLSRGSYHFGDWNHHSSGRGQSLCRGFGAARDRFQPFEFVASLQFFWDRDLPLDRRPPDSRDRELRP